LYGVYTYLGTGLAAVGFSSGQVARAILYYGFGAIAGALIGGRLADRMGPNFVAGASLAALCACFLLLRLALSAGTLVEFTLGLSSAVAQMFFPAQQAGLAKDFPARSGTVLAWNNSALFLGIALGSLIGGKAVTIGNFAATLTICAGIALAGCIITGLVAPLPTLAQRAFGLAAVRRFWAVRGTGSREIPDRCQSAPEAPKSSATLPLSVHRTPEWTGA
jgi:predicted MFS family arabinose efflux permease